MSEDKAEAKVSRPGGCICAVFRDTGGFRIGDLACPRHGLDGDLPTDGPWDDNGRDETQR